MVYMFLCIVSYLVVDMNAYPCSVQFSRAACKCGVSSGANPAWTRSVHLDAPGQQHGQQPISGTADPGVVKQDKSSGGSVVTTKTRSDPQRVRMSSGERPMGTANGKQPNTEALCQTPPLSTMLDGSVPNPRSAATACAVPVTILSLCVSCLQPGASVQSRRTCLPRSRTPRQVWAVVRTGILFSTDLRSSPPPSHWNSAPQQVCASAWYPHPLV